jgi:hypothetical protein
MNLHARSCGRAVALAFVASARLAFAGAAGPEISFSRGRKRLEMDHGRVIREILG